MKKLLLLLVPLALFAQVEIDTVLRLPTSNLGRGFFIPELNKLYVDDYPDGYFVLDCSTYQLRPNVPGVNLDHYSWNWRRQKLYVTYGNGPDSTQVIDVAADTVLGWLDVCREWPSDVYLGDVDRRYNAARNTTSAGPPSCQ